MGIWNRIEFSKKNTIITKSDNLNERQFQSSDQELEVFRFYSEMADRTKGRAQSLTTWILTLNSGIFAFCFRFYIDNLDDPAFLPKDYESAFINNK